MDSAAIRAVFQKFDPPLWIVTAAADGRSGCLVATFVVDASIVPDAPRVLVGLAKHHHTRGLVEASGGFALHLIGEAHLDWVWRFGLQSGETVDKLEGLASRPGVCGSPILSDALAYLDCRVEAKLDTGDRTVYLAEIVAGETRSQDRTLTRDRLIALTPPDKLSEMRRQMQHDAEIDGAAIGAWRAQKIAGPKL